MCRRRKGHLRHTQQSTFHKCRPYFRRKSPTSDRIQTTNTIEGKGGSIPKERNRCRQLRCVPTKPGRSILLTCSGFPCSLASKSCRAISSRTTSHYLP